MNLLNKLFILITTIAFVGCATEPFQPGKPVTADGNFFSRSFVQNNKKVNMIEITNHLKTNDATKEKATTSQTWFYAALVPSAVGGYLIGYNLVANSDNKSTNILLGVGLVGVGMGLAYLSDKNLVEAVEVYNQGLSKGTKKKTGTLIKPSIGIAYTAKDMSPLLGVSISY